MVRVRILIAFVISIIVFSTQPQPVDTKILTSAYGIVIIIKEVAIGVTAGLILSIIGLFIFFAEYTAPYDPIEINMEGRKAPSLEHIFGTDRLGRDIFSRIIYGGRISILIGLASVAIGLSIGTVVGIISGYYGRWIDNTIMRLMDSLLAFPGILLALVIIAVLGPGLINVTLAVGVSSIPEYARLARGKVLEVREMQYIEAVRSIGVNDFFIMVKHIIPNISICGRTSGRRSYSRQMAPVSYTHLTLPTNREV